MDSIRRAIGQARGRLPRYPWQRVWRRVQWGPPVPRNQIVPEMEERASAAPFRPPPRRPMPFPPRRERKRERERDVLPVPSFDPFSRGGGLPGEGGRGVRLLGLGRVPFRRVAWDRVWRRPFTAPRRVGPQSVMPPAPRESEEEGERIRRTSEGTYPGRWNKRTEERVSRLLRDLAPHGTGRPASGVSGLG